MGNNSASFVDDRYDSGKPFDEHQSIGCSINFENLMGTFERKSASKIVYVSLDEFCKKINSITFKVDDKEIEDIKFKKYKEPIKINYENNELPNLQIRINYDDNDSDSNSNSNDEDNNYIGVWMVAVGNKFGESNLDDLEHIPTFDDEKYMVGEEPIFELHTINNMKSVKYWSVYITNHGNTRHICNFILK